MGKSQKLHGTRSDEKGEWGLIVMFFYWKKLLREFALIQTSKHLQKHTHNLDLRAASEKGRIDGMSICSK